MAVNETPGWWFEESGIVSWCLAPFSWLYSRAAARRMHAAPAGAVAVPVLCVGNFVAGGGGKTPTGLALAKRAMERGLKPGFLSRGYGGKISRPVVVNIRQHNAADVGDEPLLLAREALTVVSSDRLTGANLLVENGADFIIMDDGFQNPRLRKDFNLVVVDSRRGIGNGFPMPAGPLRVSLRDQLILANAVLVIGKDPGGDRVIRRAAMSAKPLHLAKLALHEPEKWRDRWIIPFAGIADPEKFFRSLRDAGADLAHLYAFGDHHYFNEEDVTELLDRARLLEAQLVTTAKDYVRLLGLGKNQQKLAEASMVVRVSLEFEDDHTPDWLIDQTIARFDARMQEKPRAG